MIRCTLEFEAEDDEIRGNSAAGLADHLRAIAYDLERHGDVTGFAMGNSYDLEVPGLSPEPIELDRRQRLVAALAMIAFDLPQPAEKASRAMLQAARLCPGATTQDLPMGNRRAALEKAKVLLDEMLAE